MINSKTKKTVQILISILLLALLLKYVSIEDVIKTFLSADATLLFVAILMALFNRLLMPFKWMLLLKVNCKNVKFYELVKIYFVSTFLGFFLPPTLGQDSIRAYYLSKKNCSFDNTISSIVIERYLGLLITVIFGLIGYALLLNNFGKFESIMGGFLNFTVVFFVLILTLFFVSFNGYFYSKVVMLLNNKRRGGVTGKIANLVTKIYESYFSYRDNKLTLLIFFVLTVFEISITIVRSYIISLSFGVDLSVVFFFSFLPIILFLIRLPISFDGFGIHEGGFVFFMEMAGVDPAVAFSIGSLNHLIFILLILPGWYFYATSKIDMKLSNIRADNE